MPIRHSEAQEYQLGQLAAHTLREECALRGLAAGAGPRQDYNIVADIHHMTSLNINDTVRDHLKSSAFSNPELELVFCYVSLQTDKSPACDIDHLEPHRIFKARQIQWVRYLNDHPTFAAGFLGKRRSFLAEPSVKLGAETGAWIRNCFKIFQGRIYATHYFLRICYNQLDNLLYLKHGVNLDKSDTPVQDFLEQYAPSALQDSLKEYGGLQSGIIFKRVLKTSENTARIQFFDGQRAVLHGGAGCALAPFIRHWFASIAPNITTYSESIYDMHTTLTAQLRQHFLEEPQEAEPIEKAPRLKRKDALDKLWHQRLCWMKLILERFNAPSALRLRSQSQGSTSSEEGAHSAKKQIISQQWGGFMDYARILTSMKKEVVRHWAGAPEDVGTLFYELWIEHMRYIPMEDMSKACNTLKANLTGQELQSADEIVAQLSRLRDDFDPAFLRASRQAEAQARQTAEQKATAAEQKAAVETQARQNAERRIRELEAQLQSQNQGQRSTSTVRSSKRRR